MTSSVRHQQIINPNNAVVLPSASVAARSFLIGTLGQDYAFVSIERTIQAAEIVANPGTLADNADPTVGFLFAQFQGVFIKNIMSVHLLKNINAPATPTAANQFVEWGYTNGTAANFTKLGTRIVNPTDTTKLGYSADYTSLFMYDFGNDASRKVAAGDRIVVLLELGNS